MTELINLQRLTEMLATRSASDTHVYFQRDDGVVVDVPIDQAITTQKNHPKWRPDSLAGSPSTSRNGTYVLPVYDAPSLPADVALDAEVPPRPSEEIPPHPTVPIDPDPTAVPETSASKPKRGRKPKK